MSQFFRFTARHDRRCAESRWQFTSGYECADRNGSIKSGAYRYYTWFLIVCINCKKAKAMVRADKLAHALHLLEGRER